MAKRSKASHERDRMLTLLDLGMDAVDDLSIPGIVSFGEKLLKEKYHNPWWAGLVAMAVGRQLIKLPFTKLRRLGWTMLAVGGANTVAEVTRWSLDLAERLKNLAAEGIKTPPITEYEKTGGIGLP